MNKFVSILKKIGLAVLGAQTQIQPYASIAQAVAALSKGDADDKAVAKATAVINDGLVKFQDIILDAEVMGQALALPGSQKATMAAPAVMQLFMDLPILRGKKPVDPAQTKLDAEALGAALAKFMNGYEG